MKLIKILNIMNISNDELKVSVCKTKTYCSDAVLESTAQLLDKIPRDVEFTYNQNMDKLGLLIQENSLVPYITLLNQLHLPKVHVDDKEPMVTCPSDLATSDCSQKQSCQRIRETLSLVHLVSEKLGERSKVFEGMGVSLIGSTREGSRAFHNDEVDIHLSLSDDLKELCFFDVENQALKKRGNSSARNSDVAKYFNDADNTFLPKQFFYDFVTFVHSIISTLTLPKDFHMLPLTTEFTPCTRCMTWKLRGLQVMRCRHKSDCEHHKRCRCEEPNECKCLDECGCKEYTSPSLTWSKVGVVLHLQWTDKNGTPFSIDCDLNCPTWPTHTRFMGSTRYAESYLMREQPVGWLEEFSKLENLSAAANSPHLLTLKTWPVKFRLINKDTVLPSQVTSLHPLLPSPDSPVHECSNADWEETASVRNPVTGVKISLRGFQC